MGVPTAILKDPRKISDKNFQAKCVAKLVEVDKTYFFINIYFSIFGKRKLVFLPASPKAKAGLGVQPLRPSVRPSVSPSVCLVVRPSVPKSCHRNSSETTDPIIMKLGM